MSKRSNRAAAAAAASAPSIPSAPAATPTVPAQIGQDDVVIETPLPTTDAEMRGVLANALSQASGVPAEQILSEPQAADVAHEPAVASAAPAGTTDGPAGTEAHGSEEGGDVADDADDADDEDGADEDVDDAAAAAPEAPPVPLTPSEHWQKMLNSMKGPKPVEGYCKRSGFTLTAENAIRVNEVWGAMVAAGVTFADGEKVVSPDDALEALIELTHAYLSDLA